MKAHRPTIMGTRHMVAACQYLAAEAGFRILEAGGNAIDAGVAAGIALGVVQPEYVNFAGVAPIIIYSAAEDRVFTIPGLGPWPKAIERDYFKKHHAGKIPQGILRTVVPAAPDAWITALERFGTMSFGEVAQSAIGFARDGFPVYPLMSEIITEHEAEYRMFPSSVALYLPQGRPPRPGEIFVQKELAATIQYMADQEAAARHRGREAGLAAARDAFYRGDIAQAIVKFQKENGGFLSAEDLASYRSGFEEPVETSFGDIRLYACGPWCQGPSLLQALNLLDGGELRKLGHNSPGYLHRITEAVKLAFADREAYFGDPRVVDVPIEALLSREYARQRREMIRPDRAWPEMPPAGDPRKLAGERAPQRRRGADPGERLFCAASSTHRTSASSTGTATCSRRRRATDPTTRRWCRSSASFPRRAAARTGATRIIRPASRPASGRGSRPVRQSRSAGQDEDAVRHARRRRANAGDAAGIPQHPRVRDGGAGCGRSAARRVLQLSRPRSSRTPIIPDLLNVESRIDRSTGEALGRLGHKIEWWPDWTWLAGAVCTIVADHETGVLKGGADPRRPSYAVGW